MAQQAGVDLSEIGRRFPSNPQFPQPEGEELEYIEMVLSKDSDSFPQTEGSEGSEGNEGDGLAATESQQSGYLENFITILGAGFCSVQTPTLLRPNSQFATSKNKVPGASP